MMIVGANGQHSSVNSAKQRNFLVAFLAAAQKGIWQDSSLYWSAASPAQLERANGQYRLDRRSPNPLRCFVAIAGLWRCGSMQK